MDKKYSNRVNKQRGNVVNIDRDDNNCEGVNSMATISFDREIALNEVSAEALIKKIEHDTKNQAVLRDINIEQKLEDGKQLLKRLFSR